MTTCGHNRYNPNCASGACEGRSRYSCIRCGRPVGKNDTGCVQCNSEYSDWASRP